MLLAFLFPLQLFAGTLEPAAKQLSETAAIVPVVEARSQGGAQQAAWQLTHDVADAVTGDASTQVDAANAAGGAGDQPDAKKLSAQGDLEDQTLPAPFATLPLDWHPFPHFYPLVNDGTSAFIDLQRPPPLA
ncbi:hypothetical protein [Herbaspirillum rhizosphaerae]|uniref:hypothetical protein n=1 Tax=Herbaspirillum rhizosphaerae TaxID=346179 RepID=UPI001F0A3884|nr:hypothetical protein [Herbaspirillum rhizosphaerae]